MKIKQKKQSFLITANVPSAKKLIVHGPDLSQIPTQYSIEDHTQFSFIMQEGLDFFGVSDSKKDKHFLFDIKTSKSFWKKDYLIFFS